MPIWAPKERAQQGKELWGPLRQPVCCRLRSPSEATLPFQPFPLQEAVEVQAVEVVSKGSHTQVVVDKPRREQSQQGW